MNIIRFCIKRPISVGMFFLAVMVLGFASLSRMPMDLFPKITYPTINISTTYSGAGPEEVEQMITIPIERAVATVNRVKSITSSSQEGSSRVRVEFAWGLDLDKAANDIRASVDRVRGRLPDDAGTPTVFKFDSSALPVMTLGISSSMDEGDLRRLAEEDLSYLLQKADGVAGVDVRGGRNKEIRISLKLARLQALGLTVDEIAKVLKNENSTQPAGNLTSKNGDFLIRSEGEFQDLDEMRNLTIATQNGIPIYLRDVAEIAEGYENTRTLVRIDGKPGVVISIQKQADANTVAVADQVYKALDEIKRSYPEIHVRIINDNSTYIRLSVKGVSDAALMGGLLAALVLLLFLHNFRATLIAVIVTPISIMATLILAYFCNMSLNTVSLGGLALGVGMLLDNSVVIIDNIFRHYHQGEDIETASLNGASEMGPALLASTLTSICVFFPLIFISGRTGIVFKELAYMVIFAQVCSLGVAITLIPMLAAKYLRISDLTADGGNFWQRLLSKKLDALEISYRSILQKSLKHRALIIVGGVLLTLPTLGLLPFIGNELVQGSDEGVISINFQLPIGTTLAETDLHTRAIEKSIQELVPELNHVEVTVGNRNTNQASLTLRLVGLKERSRSTDQIIEELQEKLKIAGSRIRIHAQSSMRMLYGNSDNPIAIDIRGYDQDLAQQVVYSVQEKLSQIPGVVNVNMSRDEERPEISVRINRKRAADLGISATEIGDALQASVEGTVATVFRKKGEEIDIRVYMQESDLRERRDLGAILVQGAGGQPIPLLSVVDLVQSASPVNIDRSDQERNITVNAGISKRDLGSVMADVRRELDKLPLPTGIKIYYAGDYQEQQQSFNELLLALILSLLLIYMVMAAQFESLVDPFIIMFSVPFALGGVLLMLFLTDTNFSNQAYIGLIMLGGVVVNNAIVLISYIRILMEQGDSLTDAVENGAQSRLRPILITTISSILGLAPLALGLGEGGEIQAPLARTVIGGLTFSTVLTLILIPAIFFMIERFFTRIKMRAGKKSQSVTLGLLVLIGIGLLTPQASLAETKQRLTLNEAVRLSLQNGEAGKIIQAKRIETNAVYAENNGEKKIQVTSGLETTAAEGGAETAVIIEAERSLPLANLTGIPSLSDRIIEYNRNISLLNIKDQEAELIYKVVESYQAEILDERAVKIAEDNYNRSKRLADEVITRSKLGLTTVVDESGAEAQLAGALTSLNRARQNYRIAGLQLRQLLSLDPAAQLELSLPEHSTVIGDLPLLLTTALRQRADLQQAREEMSRAEKLLELARLSERLGISLDWNFERDHFTTGIGVSNQDKDGTSEELHINGNMGAMVFNTGKSDTYDKSGKLTLKLTWKLWDGNVRQERIKQAEAVLTQTSETVKKLEKDAALEVEEAYYNYLNQMDKVQSGALQLKYNQTYLAAVEAKLRTGLASVKDMLDAQLLLTKAESDHQETINALFMAKISLLKAIGQLVPEKLY